MKICKFVAPKLLNTAIVAIFLLRKLLTADPIPTPPTIKPARPTIIKKADNRVTNSEIPGAPFLESLQRMPLFSNFVFARISREFRFSFGSICSLYFAEKSVPGAINPDAFKSSVFTIVRGPKPKLAPASSGELIMISLKIKSVSPRLKVSPIEIPNLNTRSLSIIALLGWFKISCRARPLDSSTCPISGYSSSIAFT